MKKNKLVYILLLILVVLAGIFFLKPKKEAKIENKETLVTSVAPLKWVVSEIAGDKFNVESIVSSNVSHESFEPDVHSIQQLENAKLFFFYDNFKFEEVLEESLKDENKVVNVLAGLNKDLLLKDTHGNDVLVIGEEHHHDEDEDHHEHGEEPAYDIFFHSIKGYKHTHIDFESDKDFNHVIAEINHKEYDLKKVSDKPLTFVSEKGDVNLVLTKENNIFNADLTLNGELIKLLQMDKHEEEHHHDEDEDHHHEHEHGHHHHHDHGKGGNDPHVWFSMEITKQVAKNVLNKLIEVYPNDKKTFENNYNKFINKINDFEKSSKETLEKIGTKAFIIYHPALQYFLHDTKLYELPIEIEGKEPSAKEIKEIIEEANEHKVKIIFVQPQFSTESAKAIANEIKDGRVVEFNIDNEDVITNLNFFLSEMLK